MKAKYGIIDCDFCNFDDTGFIIGIITSSITITCAEPKGRGEKVPTSDRELATIICWITGED